MNEKTNKIFFEAKLKPEADLEEKIWRTIVLRDKHAAKIKMWAFSFLGIFSLAGLVPMLKILGNDLTRSGFYEYLSLAFSDSKLIFAHLQEFTLTLAESLPTMSLIISFSLILFFILSIRYTTKQIIRNQLSF